MNIAFIIFTVVLIVSVVIGAYRHAFRFKYATEGSASLLLGTAVTGFISLCYYQNTGHVLKPDSLRLPDSVFFQVLLPPIIFHAGFSVKKRMFFRNFAVIFTFGFFGTLTSAAALSAAAAAVMKALGMAPGSELQSALALGAICACSDTVAILQIIDQRAYPVLYSLVFGEGIVNDAVGIVLLTSVHKLASHHTSFTAAVVLELLLSFVSLFVSSLLLGVGVGLVSALMVRYMLAKKHDCDREVLLLALLGYLSYVLADALDLSGILSVFFCGVTMSHYTWHSMCPAAQALALHTFRLAAGLMEMILYAYSGINIWTSALWQAGDSRLLVTQAVSLASILLLTIVLARAAFIYPVSAAASWIMARGHQPHQQVHEDQLPLLPEPHHQQQQPQGHRISMLDASVIMWGGLCRGAITLALAYHHFNIPTPAHQVLIVSVVLVVVVGTVVLGTVTGPLMELIMTHHKQQQQQQQSNDEKVLIEAAVAAAADGKWQAQASAAVCNALLVPSWTDAAGSSGTSNGCRTASSSMVGVAESQGARQQQQLCPVNLDMSDVADHFSRAMSNAGCAGMPGTAAAQDTGAPNPMQSSFPLNNSRLPSLDAPSSCTILQEQLHQRCLAAGAAGAMPSAAFCAEQQHQQHSQPDSTAEASITRQWQMSQQLGSCGCVSGTVSADLPIVRSPPDPGVASLGTYIALSRAKMDETSDGTSSISRLQWQQQQQQQAELPADVESTTSRMHAVQVAPGAEQSAHEAELPADDHLPIPKDHDWYVIQQRRLLEQLACLLREYTQEQQQRQQQCRTSNTGPVDGSSSHGGWHGLHRLWRQFDMRYLQPVFGGREIAKLTSAPREFEHFL